MGCHTALGRSAVTGPTNSSDSTASPRQWRNGCCAAWLLSCIQSGNWCCTGPARAGSGDGGRVPHQGKNPDRLERASGGGRERKLKSNLHQIRLCESVWTSEGKAWHHCKVVRAAQTQKLPCKQLAYRFCMRRQEQKQGSQAADHENSWADTPPLAGLL